MFNLNIKKRHLAFTSIAGTLFFLTACQSHLTCIADTQHCFAPPKKLTVPPLKAGFNYIKFTVNGQPIWLAQGAIESNHTTSPIHVFYSGDGAVFKWSNGRLIAITSQDIRWREYVPKPVAWHTLWTTPHTLTFTRQVDLIDGVYALTQQREVEQVSAPRYHAFHGDATALIWFREFTPNARKNAVFDSWYAFLPNDHEPVYAQQCLSSQLCITWQKWNH